ncbi:hypothetical protein T4B_5869 [Trichinella pseudospiralis]|uniref:Uncharacterized protein n=1 Tax=Trichinella pseudospiralis TaxID=6337 RepID=A0A0V1E5P6_TRIPS|nr:hypothetical protein T4A_8984 [Trichinella pseudospiralis]KRZ14551.1 hypothetical protein T4B_5869 [Trichinella pseudospiralis]
MVQQREELMDHFRHFGVRKNYYGEEAFYTKTPATFNLILNKVLTYTVKHCTCAAQHLRKMACKTATVWCTVAVALFLRQLLRGI